MVIPSLNGIRALAFGLVFVSHAGMEDWVPGRFGVMVFFVLSGYLITTLLLREQEKTGGIALRNFYLRRILRLLPPLAAVLVLVWLAHATGLTARDYDPMAFVSYLAYFGNYYIVATEFEGVPLGTGVLWSLAVEEHFYLLYPLLFISLIVPATRRQRMTLLISLCLIALLWRIILMTVLDASTLYLESATDARFDSLLFGCLLAVSCNPMADDAPNPSLGMGLLLSALSLLVLALSFLVGEPWFDDVLRPTIHGVALLPLFYLSVRHAHHWPYAILNSRLLNYLGLLSYSLYLCHEVILGLLNEHLRPIYGEWVTAPLALFLSIVLSEVIRRLVEDPMAAVRRRLSAVPTATTHLQGAVEAEVAGSR